MYTLYDQYQDLMSKKASTYTYNGKTFTVYMPPASSEVIITHVDPDTKERYRAHSMRKNIDCMTAFQGIAILLLHEKKDLWFDRHGELCSKDEFSPVVTKQQQQEDDLDRLIDSVLDISIDDKDVNIQDFI